MKKKLINKRIKGDNATTLREIFVNGYAPMRLTTYYPIVSKYPFTHTYKRSFKRLKLINSKYARRRFDDGGEIIDVEGYPLVDSDSEGLTDWFKNNPNIAGMAIGAGLNGIGGERRIVLNPNLKDSNTRNSVYMNESYRHFFDANNISLPAITDVQREAYKGTSYEGLDRKIQETEAARYLSGDPSHHLNARQKAQLNNFRFTYPGRTLPEVEVSIKYNSKNQKR